MAKKVKPNVKPISEEELHQNVESVQSPIVTPLSKSELQKEKDKEIVKNVMDIILSIK